ncbi:hypothetical protein CWI36_0780p0010 [Hamiltosporidium magnivora]|uniref:DNA replication complex GINS protein PSF3 n=1 Tax=Hamiltosporidium magnivora TaxID=148818 RepID=A0A4Q9LA33_9MICR|nr:hypothetical protein CWI36_0780p0010 [Hamiltosporidium magnivora]
MEFYDLNLILAEETKVTVKFNHDVDFFGFYFAENLSYIPKNHSVKVPFFMVDFLLENEHCILVDDFVEENTKNNLMAKPSLVNLSENYFNFYYFGIIISKYLNIKDFLFEVFCERTSDFCNELFTDKLTDDNYLLMDINEKIIMFFSAFILEKYRRFLRL